MLASARWPAFLAEHPGAVNTTIGVMIDPVGSYPWQPDSVKLAREDALQSVLESGTFGYQNQSGYAEFLAAAGEQVFGRDEYIRHASEILAYQTLGGTGAVTLARDVLEAVVKADRDGNIPLVLDAGWPNHPAIFTQPFAVHDYPHLDEQTGTYDHDAALTAFNNAPDNAVFLLQTCGYNDDGMDRTPEQWDEILQLAQTKQATVLLDSAYMGLVKGFDDDRYPIEQSVERGLLTLVCFSASKNMGLYNERLGALFIANGEQNLGNDQFPRLNQVAGRCVRRTVSNTPLVAAKAAATVLRGTDYFQQLQSARSRLNANRELFGSIVEEELPAIRAGSGLFAKMLSTGFDTDQQQVLSEAGILALPNSRINLGGLHYDQVERVGLAVMKAINLR